VRLFDDRFLETSLVRVPLCFINDRQKANGRIFEHRLAAERPFAARMKQSRISLSAGGLGNIPQRPNRNDFAFLVGNLRYSCPSYVADFLSPRIARFHGLDLTIAEYSIETPDSDHLFPLFLSLGHGETIDVNSGSEPFFVALSRELENDEILGLVIRNPAEDLTLSNAIHQFSLLQLAGRATDDAIDFIASHFCDFSAGDLSSLSYLDLQRILSHPALKLSTEDHLCRFIATRSAADPGFFGLFEFVRFEYISVEALQAFVHVVSGDLSLLNRSVWNSCARRGNERSLFAWDSPRFVGIDCPADEKSPLDGIIAYLTRCCQGNVHAQGIVNVTGKESYNDTPLNAAQNAADLNADSFFYSKDQKDQYLCYDFRNNAVKPTHYSIRSRYNGNDMDLYPKSWVIEGSDDGQEWIELDRRQNNQDLNSRNAVKMFPIARAKECRQIRLRQTGPNHYRSPSHCLVLSGFELFGHFGRGVERK
jgi:hypothetical protein